MKRLTDEELQAIRERVEKATEGPWVNEDDVIVSISVRERKYGYPTDIAESARESEWDAEFIAHAREDIPKLLAEIERLRSRMSHINDCAEEFFEDKGDYYEIPETTPNRDFLQEIFVISAEESGGDSE